MAAAQWKTLALLERTLKASRCNFRKTNLHTSCNRRTFSTALVARYTAQDDWSFKHHKQITFQDNQQKRFFRDEASKALMLLKDLKEVVASPGPALMLGVGGLVPFVSIPAYMVSSGCYVAGLAFSQVAYGACILSFIGAVRWGMALSDSEIVRPNWFNLGYSVTPSLLAWVALMLPTSMSLVTLIVGLAGTAYMDITLFGYPSWFKALRFLLSLFAILSLWTTLMCAWILRDKSRAETDKADEGSTSEKQSSAQMLAKIEKEVEAIASSAENKAKTAFVKAKNEISDLTTAKKNTDNDLEEKELKD